ncbi:histidine ammonia-lyase [Nocardiopsis sp. Huas11]|uniref:aromatic amino acid ammonia-lyase n=1 Tax=Nocardiopsis sp. Huas11 TaxID=2183912 RepID=UPI000EB26D17|nr:aromatic amino acid ammonia-lyase [Nocardiopsis sp. Huas11]RKS06869.1 histidine ammonia-lyase [Nocardiopsis sp. Huas11]
MSSKSSGLDEILRLTDPEARIGWTADDLARMRESATTMAKHLAEGEEVYGVTRGFGPLVAFPASESAGAQGEGLISHLGSAQGEPLSAEVSRLVFALRILSMRRGHSAVDVGFWKGLVDLWNRGFTPVIPCEGTVSASGDLQPLASAALSLAGQGEAWVRAEGGGFRRVDSAEALADLDVEPVRWTAREALAFVNGSGVGLALALHNLKRISDAVRAVALLTSRMAELLGANPQAYSEGIASARGQVGQAAVAGWIREGLTPGAVRDPSRPLQEPYSLRCASQVLGAVADQLAAAECILLREAGGTTDNPVSHDGEILHGGNFHAMPVGLASDQMGLCLQQVAFLADRQLSLLCASETNGGLPPMLTPIPGAGSGLAGVQISATSFVSRIRQLVTPSSLTALPCNNGNQDHVPVALNGANSVAQAVDLAWLVVGSLGVGLAQLAAILGRREETGVWARVAELSPPLDRDRPLAAEVRAVRDVLAEEAAARAGEWRLPDLS